MSQTYQEELLSYDAGGVAMQGRLFMPAGGATGQGAVLVFPEAPGPGEHVLGRAARLAGMGIPTLACDLHGGGLVLTEFPDIMARLGALRQNPQTVLDRAQAALDAIRSVPALTNAKVAAIGYCFGGTMALELGRSGAGLAGIVGFHSGLLPVIGGTRPGITCPVLACVGGDDPTIKADERQAFEQEMRKAGVKWTLQVYGGVVHAFTDPQIERLGKPDFARYDSWADEQSWLTMLRFFDQVF